MIIFNQVTIKIEKDKKTKNNETIAVRFSIFANH